MTLHLKVGKNKPAGKIHFKWLHNKCFLPYSNTLVKDQIGEEKAVEKNSAKQMLTLSTVNMKYVLT